MVNNRGSRYFDGYQRDLTGKLVYTGPWYGCPAPGQQRRVKGLCAVWTVLLLTGEVLAQFFPSAGGMARYMAIPSLLSLVPLMFWLMGMAQLLVAKDKWELRVFYSGHRRLERSAVVLLAVSLGWVLCEAVFLLGHVHQAAGEIRYGLCVLLIAGASLGMVLTLKKHPPQVVQGPLIR